MGLGVTVAGFSGSVADTGGTALRALKVHARPLDYASFGSYQKSLSSSVSTILGSTILMFGFLWVSTSRICVVGKFTMDGLFVGPTAYAAAGSMDASASLRREASAISGAVNGTFTGNNGKMRTSMATSSGASMSITATSAGITLTGGNGPVTQLAYYSGTASTAVAAPVFPVLNLLGRRQRLALSSGDCLTAELSDQGGATGSQSFGYTVAWTEVSSY